jgi:hypothetical protein
MGPCKIICSLDGEESEFKLYGKFIALANGTFPNDQHAILVQRDLSRRAREMRWDAEPPTYDIVPANE